MKFCNGLGFSGYRHIRFVHIDVIALTLGRPEPDKAFPLQASVVDHFVEHPLPIVKDSPSLQTCRKQRLWTSDISKLSQASKFCSSVPILWRHTGTPWIELWIKQMNGCMNYFEYELCYLTKCILWLNDFHWDPLRFLFKVAAWTRRTLRLLTWHCTTVFTILIKTIYFEKRCPKKQLKNCVFAPNSASSRQNLLYSPVCVFCQCCTHR